MVPGQLLWAVSSRAPRLFPEGACAPTPWFTSWALSRSRPAPERWLHACCVHEPPVETAVSLLLYVCSLLTMLGCSFLCGNQTPGAPRHRRDVVPVTASDRNLTHWLISTQVRSSSAARRGRRQHLWALQLADHLGIHSLITGTATALLVHADASYAVHKSNCRGTSIMTSTPSTRRRSTAWRCGLSPLDSASTGPTHY